MNIHFKRTLRYFSKNPLRAGILVLIPAVVIFLIVSFSTGLFAGKYPGNGLIFKDQYWKENEDGFKYYDKEPFINTFGIDISEWAGEVDFSKLKNYGVEFVILRVGYRGYETGKFVLDENLGNYLRGAKKAGLKTGVYFVSQAINEEEAVEEAEYVMDHIRGYDMEMPLYLDLEIVRDAARTDVLSRSDRTRIAAAFCEEVIANGYQAGIYANESWYKTMLDFRKLSQYDIWLAKYTDTPSTKLPIDMWQFTDQGIFDGAENTLDLNVRVSEKTKETTE